MLKPIFKNTEEQNEYNRQRCYYAGCAVSAMSKYIGNYSPSGKRDSIKDNVAVDALLFADTILEKSGQFDFVETDE